jgi:L-serine kinase (ADP)
MIVDLPNENQLDLRIVAVHDLIPHEQVIPLLLDSVRRDIERTGCQRDPIIIDESTNLVLDGMHRRAALESLSSQFALCAAFDYLDETVILQRWLRYFIAPDRQMLDEIIGLFDLEKAENYETAMQMVDSHKSPIALLSGRQSYSSTERYDLQTVYRRLGDFDRIAAESNIQVDFRAESEHSNPFLSESVFVLYPTPFTKEDILHVASNHRLFPYKTTRHLVPVRPMGMYFPFYHLKSDNLEVCNSKLAELVARSQIDLIEPNSWYEGRQYSETLAIFKRHPNSKKEDSKKR